MSYSFRDENRESTDGPGTTVQTPAEKRQRALSRARQITDAVTRKPAFRDAILSRERTSGLPEAAEIAEKLLASMALNERRVFMLAAPHDTVSFLVARDWGFVEIVRRKLPGSTGAAPPPEVISVVEARAMWSRLIDAGYERI